MMNESVVFGEDIPQHWQICKLKNVVQKFGSGMTPNSKNESYYPNLGTCFVMISDMSNCEYVEDTEKKVSKNAIVNYNLSIYPAGSLLYSMYATVGKISQLGVDATISQAILAIVVDEEKIDKEYLKNVLKCLEGYVKSRSNGNTQDNVNLKIVKNLPIVLPPINEQKIIVQYLKSKTHLLDKIIANSHTEISYLDDLKKTVRNNSVLFGIKGESRKTIREKWIEITPQSWTIYRINNIYFQPCENGQTGLPFLTVSINEGISDRELSDEEQDRVFIRTEDATKNKRVQPNDLAYNMMRAWQGAFGAAKVEGMISSAYVVARPKVNISSKFMEWLFRTPNAMEEIRTRSHGIADFRLRLYWDQFKNIKVSIPSYEEQLEIVGATEKKLEKIDEYISKIQKHIELLNEYRQSLIYEIITGERIPYGQ